MNYFKVGQTVYSYLFGSEDYSGVIRRIIDGECYPIQVSYIRYGESHTYSFTVDGKYRDVDIHPSLSQTPLPKIELVPLQEEFEPGELVWCHFVSYGGSWEVRHYSHFDDNFHYVCADQKKNGKPVKVYKIRKFNDNPLI